MNNHTEYMREWRLKNPHKAAEVSARSYLNNKPMHAYHAQKRAAARRGIEFDMTYDEWIEFWGDDLSLRGTGPDDLAMCRFNDEGAYRIGNVEKNTMSNNGREARLAQMASATES